STTITVAVINDPIPEPAETVILTLTPSVSYTVRTPSTATVTIADDDQPGVTVSAISGHTTESGGTATFTVVLNTQPSSTVTIPLASTRVSEGPVSPASLAFTTGNWNVPQMVTVTGVNDAVTDGNQAYQITLGPPTGDPVYAALAITPVDVINDDNEPEVS